MLTDTSVKMIYRWHINIGKNAPHDMPSRKHKSKEQ